MAVRGREPEVEDPVPLDADTALETLYAAHYASLVRIAALLLHDHAAAEDVVQDAFVAMRRAWPLRNPEAAPGYLRRSVVNRSRSRLRHLKVAARRDETTAADPPSAEQAALGRLDRASVMAALRALPARQREAVVMRYYADFSEAQIAEAMGCSRGAVKSHTARGIAALRKTLEPR